MEGTGERTVSLRMRMRKKADGGGGALSGQQFAFRGRIGVHGLATDEKQPLKSQFDVSDDR